MDMDNCDNVPKVPYDPGWNDPPTLSYNMQQSTPNRPRNYLNKRVAFPLSGNNPNPGYLPHMNLPKMPSMPPVPSPSVPKHNSCEDIDLDDEGTLTEVKSILLKFLEDSPELGSKANDIRKRISVMEDMWSNNKLNKMVHVQMKQLAEALRDNQPSTADNIHRALMVDHVSVVGTWMPGVKHLVHHCIAHAELLAIDME